MFRDIPIRRKVIAIMLLTSGTVLLLTCLAFIGYEFQTYRQNMLRSSQTLGQVIATNATAALAFENEDDAQEILSALKAEPQIVAAALYDQAGTLFAIYPGTAAASTFPKRAPDDGYRFAGQYLIGAEAVHQGNNNRLGTLYIQLDQRNLYRSLELYSVIALTMTAVGFLIAYLLARALQRQISAPVLHLSNVASQVATRYDYSLRAEKYGKDEIGSLTDAFNKMLGQIQEQDINVRDSETRIRAVLDSALSAVVVIDHDGNIIEWNPRAEQIFGWSRTEAIGKELAETIVPYALRESHRQGMAHYLRTGVGPILNKQLELMALHRNGHEFPVELSISPLKTSGALTFCGFITDITESKRAQQRIHEQLTRLDLLHRITSAIGERQDLKSIFGVVLRNLEDNLPIDFGCICLYEPIQHSLKIHSLGIRTSKLATAVGYLESTSIGIDENGLSSCVSGQMIYEPNIETLDFDLPRRLAGIGLRSMVSAPLTAENKIFGVLIVARHATNGFSSSDCEFLLQLSEHVALATQQVQLYEELQQAYEDLRQSQQTTLQQERLRALGQMASGVAHDINNAISPITLYTESLLEREPGLSERARSYLTTIQRAVEDVAQTVSRMREFYRAREPQLMLTCVNLNDIVQQVIELTRAKWRDVPQQRGVVIELHTDLKAQPANVMGADSEIRDALTNLVFNAVDAMPEGGTLTLRTHFIANPISDTQPNSEMVALEVVDTGIGMDEQTRRQCLEPFFTTKGERGTGLGLAMVYGMVQRHSAELQIDSTPGAGCTVRFVFARAEPTPRPAMPPLFTQPGMSLHILLVDDDPLIIEALTEILRRDGHRVSIADGGQAGIDLFQAARVTSGANGPIDGVITDLGMPYVDGRRVAAAIKSISPRTPVIMLTGWGQRLLEDGDTPAHVDRILSKPPKLEELRRALRELFSPPILK